MNQMGKTYSIFCDESCYLQFDDSDIMCMGAIVVPNSEFDFYKSEIKRIKRKYGILHELKWNTVSRTRLKMYEEILQFFFQSSMTFRCILIKNKSLINDHILERVEYNKFYYSIIEHLIRLIIRHNDGVSNSYRIFLDLKDNKGKNQLVSIYDDLASKIENGNKIISLQNIRSHESQFIQLADIITGAIAYKARGLNGSEAKLSIVNIIENLSGYNLNEETQTRNDKFSIYNHQPKKSNG